MLEGSLMSDISLDTNLFVGHLFVDEGVITPEQLELGLAEQRKTGDFICACLVNLGFLPEEKMLGVLSQYLNTPAVKLSDKEIAPSVIQKIPARLASHYKILPLEFKDNRLTIAMRDPQNFRALDEIELFLGMKVQGVYAGELELQDALSKYYGVGAATAEKIVEQQDGMADTAPRKEKAKDVGSAGESASIVKFVNQMLSEAVRERATDIHIEPYQETFYVRFRIDGILHKIHMPESIEHFYQAIVSRIKIMASLDIAEHRFPQDGRIKIKVNEEELDLRISILPMVFGEAVHIRILSSQFFLKLDSIGLAPVDIERIKKIIKQPNGIIFVTGPTGSGKSTTLYAFLSHIRSSALNIITIEDPVEYQLKGINQIQVKYKIGLDFATGLRHVLRHDPDILMVGEVRDRETADIAIRAALTGHLVFSTLHTNDAVGAVTRLIDMGIEPFLVSSSIECLIAQRLVRLICPKCRVPVKSKAVIREHLKEMKYDAADIALYEGKGCAECKFTGYRGRTGIYEIVTITDPIRELILRRASSQQIRQEATAQGMTTLRKDGLQKALQGLTTIAEVIRATQEE